MSKHNKRILIHISASDSQHHLIARAAARFGKTPAEFILDSACHRAEKVLLEANLVERNEISHQADNLDLDASVPDSDALRKLLNRKSPWMDS